MSCIIWSSYKMHNVHYIIAPPIRGCYGGGAGEPVRYGFRIGKDMNWVRARGSYDPLRFCGEGTGINRPLGLSEGPNAHVVQAGRNREKVRKQTDHERGHRQVACHG